MRLSPPVRERSAEVAQRMTAIVESASVSLDNELKRRYVAKLS
jgi:hypothetical protein